MIITDKFVMLNFPKTGSTFTRAAIKNVYRINILHWKSILQIIGMSRPVIEEKMLPKILEGAFNGIIDQHGKYVQIPQKHRGKPVLSIVRNPLTRLVSNYYFKWWQNILPDELPKIQRVFPKFPELTFPEFYEFQNHFYRPHFLNGVIPQYDMGESSIFFILFYSRDPISILQKADENYLQTSKLKEDFSHIHFIHQENLVSELKAFLKDQGLDQRQIDHIDKITPLNNSSYPSEMKDFKSMYSDELLGKMIKQERLLFELFPEYLPRVSIH